MDEQYSQNTLSDIDNKFNKDLADIFNGDDANIKEQVADEADNTEPLDSSSADKNEEHKNEEQLVDIEDLAETVNDILDKVSGIANDNKSYMHNTDQRLIDLELKLDSILVSLNELSDLPQSLKKSSDSISDNVTNLQSAINQVTGYTEQCVKELQNAADEIPRRLLEDCTNQNQKALDTAVANFNAMNAASQKWLKKLGRNSDWATQIVSVSGILIPVLLLLSIIFIFYAMQR